ncbi:hypothetical protein MTO96_023657 [Rhipicephalus appendiculatus]
MEVNAWKLSGSHIVRASSSRLSRLPTTNVGWIKKGRFPGVRLECTVRRSKQHHHGRLHRQFISPRPLPSQHVLFRPDCSVAIRLPGGVIRSVHPGQQAFGTASPQGRAAIRADQKSRLLLMHTTLVEPSFESIYNSILQSPPRVTTGPEPSGPGDVARPGRATSSTRTVSFDDSLTTVVPLEPPPEAFKCDTADTTVSSEPGGAFPVAQG